MTKHGRRLRTGDLFHADAEGFLHFVSRKDDIIKTRGEKVSPQEVERVLYALPGIREAAVAGIDDPIFGQSRSIERAAERRTTASRTSSSDEESDEDDDDL